MALKDYYNTGDDSVLAFTDATWWCQNFTASSSYSFASVKLLLYRVGTSTGTVTIIIRATDVNNKPTGATLAIGTFDGDTLTTDAAGEWKETIFDVPLAVTSSSKYSIQCYRSSATSTVYWRYDGSTPSYSGGEAARSTDSGSSWTVFTSVDCMFETYSAEGTPVDATGTIASISVFTGDLLEADVEDATGTISCASTLSGVGEIETFKDCTGTITITSTLSGSLTNILILCTGTIAIISYLIGRLSIPYIGLVYPRPPIYDPDKIWDESLKEWLQVNGSGGSRYQTQLLAVGQDDSGYGVIYYGGV